MMGVPTGANLGAARGSVEISTTQAERAPTVMAGVAQGINRAMGTVNASVTKTEKGIGGLTGKFNELDSALGATFLAAGIAQIARLTIELGEAAAQAEGTRNAFDTLAAGIGETSDALLASMQKASRGTISENNLILGANRALISGAADSTKELTQILEIARATGRAFGVDTEDAYSRIVRGIAKLEPELLDELGITLRLDTVYRNYAASLGTTADRLNEAQRRQALFNEIVRQTRPAVEAAQKAGDTAADKYDRFGAAVDDSKKAAGEFFNTMQLPFWVELFAANMKQAQKELQFWIDLAAKAQQAWRDFTNAVGISQPAAPVFGAAPWGTRGAPPGFTPPPPDPDAQERAQAKLDWAEGVQKLNDELHDDILDAERDYGHQRQQVIDQYNKNIEHEARDFAISRQRQEQELVEGIAKIHEEAGRNELRMARDLARNIVRAQNDSAERIAEAREDTTKRLLELEEEYQKERERSAEEHRDKLLSAAGRLDAIALLEERKRYAREREDSKEAHDKQRDDLNEQLDERIADENKALQKSIDNANEAHQRQLADQREADRLRIEEMRAEHVKRKALEDADRALRLQDMADDHRDQLAEMDRAQGERIAQLNRHAAEERAQLDFNHKQFMVEHGARNDEWLAEVRRVEEERKRIYDETWGNPTRNGSNMPQSGYPGPWNPNRIVPPTPAMPLATQSAHTSSRISSFNGDINIVIAGSTNMGESEMYRVARQAFVDALEEVGGRN